MTDSQIIEILYAAKKWHDTEQQAAALALVEESGANLERVPDEFITPELCAIAVENDALALGYVPNLLKTPALCLKAVQSKGLALISVPDVLKTPEMCLAASRNDRLALQFVPISFRTELEIALDLALAFAPDKEPSVAVAPHG